ncbi:MAG: phosphomannomutase CpsG [Ferrimonas sp.]
MDVSRCFKAYDIRGRLGDELDEALAYRIGRAFAEYLQAQTVVIGGDIRLSTEGLKRALAEGLMASGANVIDLGMVGTEQVYFATRYVQADGGIMVTASHNPIDYNGMKLVKSQSQPLSSDIDLPELKALVQTNEWPTRHHGQYRQQSVLAPYLDHLMSYINAVGLSPLKMVVNAGNGAAGPVLDAIEERFKAMGVPWQFIKIHHQPNGHFPNGIPNPLLPDRRAATTAAILAHGADLGIAWDGDFDRCFLFDHQGQFIEGYYIVGLLAQAFACRKSGEKVIHDPRLYWNTEEIMRACHGHAISSKTGHAFIKQRMRDEDAIYGGEMSAHHYFRDFGYCDSGMVPWLLIGELCNRQRQSLESMVRDRITAFPASGELNYTIKNSADALDRIERHYQHQATEINHLDGLSMAFSDPTGAWRFNLRCSNTEPLVRLNVESKGDRILMQQQTNALVRLLGFPAVFDT